MRRREGRRGKPEGEAGLLNRVDTDEFGGGFPELQRAIWHRVLRGKKGKRSRAVWVARVPMWGVNADYRACVRE
jgi:hypothetical protein